MYAIIIPDMLKPKSTSNVFLINDIFDSRKILFPSELELENVLAINNIDQKTHTNTNKGITIAEVDLLLKNPPGYFEMRTVIVIKNNMNNPLPYLENDDTFSKIFVEFFEFVKFS